MASNDDGRTEEIVLDEEMLEGSTSEASLDSEMTDASDDTIVESSSFNEPPLEIVHGGNQARPGKPLAPFSEMSPSETALTGHPNPVKKPFDIVNELKSHKGLFTKTDHSGLGITSNSEWNRSLYSADAGLVKRGSDIIKKFVHKTSDTGVAAHEVLQYVDYEFENFTFLQEVIPNLFLGSLLALEASALEQARVTRILTVMASNPENYQNSPLPSHINREYIKMRDQETFQSHPWYQTTSAIIDSALYAGERILVHCRMGISRSATVIAAYLMFRHGFTPEEAITWLRIRRSIVNPNYGFREQLEDYYSVLQIDHGTPFGWKELSMCETYHFNEGYEEEKRQKRLRVGAVKKYLKKEYPEWVKCRVVGWDDTVERLVQAQLSR